MYKCLICNHRLDTSKTPKRGRPVTGVCTVCWGDGKWAVTKEVTDRVAAERAAVFWLQQANRELGESKIAAILGLNDQTLKRLLVGKRHLSMVEMMLLQEHVPHELPNLAEIRTRQPRPSGTGPAIASAGWRSPPVFVAPLVAVAPAAAPGPAPDDDDGDDIPF